MPDVDGSMVRPASRATWVGAAAGCVAMGTLAIVRWLRPVSYQNLPAALLPHPELQG